MKNPIKVKITQTAEIELSEVIDALKQEIKNLTGQDYRNINATSEGLYYEEDISYHGSPVYKAYSIKISPKDAELVKAMLNLIETYNHNNGICE